MWVKSSVFCYFFMFFMTEEEEEIRHAASQKG